jgi:FdhD protein
MGVLMADELAQGLAEVACRRFEHGAWRDFTDTVSPEVRVTLFWPGVEPKELWAFPEGLSHLALGHALLEFCPGDCRPELQRRDQALAFHLVPVPASDDPGHAPSFTALSATVLQKAMAEFIERQGRWDSTGCFHRMAAFDPDTRRFTHQVEDIGRHNCVDRMAGWALEADAPASGLALFVSARVTASLADKIARAGFPLVVSRSAVTTAGLAICAEAGLTLAGFARENRFTVFTDRAGRILDPRD